VAEFLRSRNVEYPMMKANPCGIRGVGVLKRLDYGILILIELPDSSILTPLKFEIHFCQAFFF
jgi:hypothetical protein